MFHLFQTTFSVQITKQTQAIPYLIPIFLYTLTTILRTKSSPYLSEKFVSISEISSSLRLFLFTPTSFYI